MERQQKRVSDSKTEQIQIIFPSHINGSYRLFGGKLVEWIDIVATAVARRHSNHNITTVCIDHLQFKAPVYVNGTIILVGYLTYVGNTSMEVCVETYSEDLKDGSRELVNRAYLVEVALDEQEQPITVPGLILETEEEKREWQAGIKRNNLRKQRSIEQF